jgi:hypothetical protein
MATFKSKTFGKISGKYGDALTTKSKATGKNYLRVASVPTNPRTDKQVAHRSKFGFTNSVLVPFNPIFKKNFGGHMGIRFAVNHVFKNAVLGEYPDYLIDFSNLKVAAGNLAAVANLVLEKAGTAKFRVDWDTTITDNSNPASLAAFVCFDEEKRQVLSITSEITLTAGTATVDMPVIWNGDNIHVWIYFILPDSSAKSNNKYIGSVVQ